MEHPFATCFCIFFVCPAKEWRSLVFRPLGQQMPCLPLLGGIGRLNAYYKQQLAARRRKAKHAVEKESTIPPFVE
jgi:hypothetical protein